ncbi:hypothetical protein MMC10_004554 [Thelotrema lepadinum]|nr:hypothetical protein [Thelotrema lepadinum]
MSKRITDGSQNAFIQDVDQDPNNLPSILLRDFGDIPLDLPSRSDDHSLENTRLRRTLIPRKPILGLPSLPLRPPTQKKTQKSLLLSGPQNQPYSGLSKKVCQTAITSIDFFMIADKDKIKAAAKATKFCLQHGPKIWELCKPEFEKAHIRFESLPVEVREKLLSCGVQGDPLH